MKLAGKVLFFHEANEIKPENIFEGFEVTDVKADSPEWKDKEVKDLAKLIGAKITREHTWGSVYAEKKGVQIDITANRRKPWIDIRVGHEEIRIKGELSDKQVKNLQAKVDLLVQTKLDAENKHVRLSEIMSKLFKKEIRMNDAGYFTVNDEEFRIVNGKIDHIGSIGTRWSIDVALSDGEKGVDKKFAELKKDFMKQMSVAQKALDKAEKNKSDIEKYYEIKNEGK